MDFEKAYFEYYAKLHIDYACNFSPRYLKKSERPDFVSSENKLGLEVTRAVIEEWARQEAVVKRHLKKRGPDFGIIREIEADADNDFPGDPRHIAGVDGEVREEHAKIHTKRIIERIDEKTEMLSQYQACAEQWLYVFSETLVLNSANVREIKGYYDNIERTVKFQRVFIHVGENLFMLENNGEIREIPAKRHTIRRLKLEATFIASAKSTKK